MDIVTHAMMGAIAASALAEDQPEAAAAFVLGSVLPDLDALSRCFGKRAFLRFHQSQSHGLPNALFAGGLLWILIQALDWHAPWAAPGLALGMLFHSALDYTNTYGITLFAPFSRRRFCTEWVFFIDAVVIAASLAALLGIWQHQQRHGELGYGVQLVYGAAMLSYWGGKVALRRRGLQLSPPETLSLLPSALVPWHFFGCARQGESVVLFRVDLWRRRMREEGRVAILDARYETALAGVPEFTTMRRLSPAYHVVEEQASPDGTKLVCRDLRTRNFGTRFGQLDLLIDARSVVRQLVFHV